MTGNRTSFYLTRISAFSIALCFCSAAPGQTKEKPKLKNFGSSLERIKWDSEKKIAVEAKSQSDRGKDSGDVDIVRVETSLVTNDLLVLDTHGQPVAGLLDRDFVVTEDGRPQQVGLFSVGDNASVPRSIVLIIDYSCSQYPFLRTSIAAAKSMVDKLSPLDRMAIVTDDVELLQDFTNNKKKLKDKLEVLLERPTPASPFLARRMGKSRQYSALMATLKEAFSSEDERPIIIFQTDGDQLPFLREPLFVPSRLYHENGGDDVEVDPRRIEKRIASQRTEFSLEDIIRAAENSRATIYTIVPGFGVLGRSPEDQMKQVRADLEQRLAAGSVDMKARRKFEKRMTPEMLQYEVEGYSKTQFALAAVSTASGGWIAFLETPSQADEIYSHIFSDINRRYLVGYYPTNKQHDGKRRKVTISVRDHPEYMVMGRQGYYAPDPDE